MVDPPREGDVRKDQIDYEMRCTSLYLCRESNWTDGCEQQIGSNWMLSEEMIIKITCQRWAQRVLNKGEFFLYIFEYHSETVVAEDSRNTHLIVKWNCENLKLVTVLQSDRVRWNDPWTHTSSMPTVMWISSWRTKYHPIFSRFYVKEGSMMSFVEKSWNQTIKVRSWKRCWAFFFLILFHIFGKGWKLGVDGCRCCRKRRVLVLHTSRLSHWESRAIGPFLFTEVNLAINHVLFLFNGDEMIDRIIP